MAEAVEDARCALRGCEHPEEFMEDGGRRREEAEEAGLDAGGCCITTEDCDRGRGWVGAADGASCHGGGAGVYFYGDASAGEGDSDSGEASVRATSHVEDGGHGPDRVGDGGCVRDIASGVHRHGCVTFVVEGVGEGEGVSGDEPWGGGVVDGGARGVGL